MSLKRARLQPRWPKTPVAGPDARKGVFPHRDATTAFALAQDREYADIVAAIEEEEQRRRQGMSCPNATSSPVQDQINVAIREGDNAAAIRLLEADVSLVRACVARRLESFCSTPGTLPLRHLKEVAFRASLTASRGRFRQRRLVQEHLHDYHENRVHDALTKDSPTGRVLERRQTDAARVRGVPRVGGLHHRDQWQSAA